MLIVVMKLETKIELPKIKNMKTARAVVIQMVKQPKGSTICGQCCVAMITGKALDEVIKVFGHSHATRTKELHKVLKHFGYTSNSKLIRFTNFSGLPDLGIVKITYDWRKHNGHWAVIKNIDGIANFMVYCPSGEIDSWLTYGFGKGRITSFLTIKPTINERESSIPNSREHKG